MSIPFSGSFFEVISNNELAKKLRLSILVTSDGFSFTTFNAGSGKIEAYGAEDAKEKLDDSNLTRAFEDFILRHKWIANDFQSRSLIIETRYNTLVPEALFDPGLVEQFFTFNYGDIPVQKILNNEINENSSRLIYALPSALNNYIESTRYFTHIFSHLTILLEKQLLKSRTETPGYRAFLYIRRNAIDLMMFNGKNLIFQNSFNYSHPVDILYYVTYSFEQMGFGQHATKLEIAGNIVENDTVYNLISKYIEYIGLSETAGNLPDGVQSIDDYRKYYIILNSSLCVSLAEITGAGI